MRVVPIDELEQVLDELGGSAQLARDIIYLSARGMRIRYAGKGVRISKNHLKNLQSLDLDYIFLQDPFCEEEVDLFIDEDSRVGLKSLLYDFQVRCSVVLDIYLSEESGQFRLDYNFRDFWQRYSRLSLAQMTRYKKMLQDLVYVIRSNYTQRKISPLPYRYTIKTFLYNHPINVGIISGILALHFGEFNAERMMHLVCGAVLHDTGLIESVLRGNHKFSDLLFFKHSRLGCMLVNETELLSPLMGIIALEHHRYLNNTGWPDDIPEKDFYGYPRQMHLYSKIVSVAETFEVLRSFYPAHKVLSVLEYFKEKLFEGRVVDLLRKYICPYYRGELVKLSTGEEAIVLKVFSNPERYELLIVRDKNGQRPHVAEKFVCEDPANFIIGKPKIDSDLKARLLKLVSSEIVNLLEGGNEG